jgi:3-polyprenyl-4-hydroxybenzoate decarboxylase
MGLGLSGAYGAAEGQLALKRLQAEDLQRQEIAKRDVQQKFENELALRRIVEAELTGATGREVSKGGLGLSRDRFEKVELPGAEHAAAKRPFEIAGLQREQTVGDMEVGTLQMLDPTQRKQKFGGLTFRDAASPDQVSQRAIEDGRNAGAATQAEYAGGGKAVREDASKFDLGLDLRRIDAQGGWGLRQARENATLRSTIQRPATGEQRQTRDYYTRMREALDNMTAVEDQLSAQDIAIIQNAPPDGILANLAEMGLSEAGKRYAQAARSYTLAKLRKESGAAISSGEFSKEGLAVLRNSTDTPASLEQKRRSRETIAEGFAASSGPAYEDFYGTPFQRGQTAPAGKTLTETDITAAMSANKWTREQAIAEAKKRGFTVR